MRDVTHSSMRHDSFSRVRFFFEKTHRAKAGQLALWQPILFANTISQWHKVLQSVAECCTVWQGVAECCRVLQSVAGQPPFSLRCCSLFYPQTPFHGCIRAFLVVVGHYDSTHYYVCLVAAYLICKHHVTVPQGVSECCRVLQVLQSVAVCYSVLQCLQLSQPILFANTISQLHEVFFFLVGHYGSLLFVT